MTVQLAPDRVVPVRACVRLGDAPVRLVLDMVGAASIAVVVLLWATGPGSANLTASPANLITALGRLSGLLAAALLLIQVLLMARVPALEAAFGRDRLVRRHRVVGFSSFVLLWLHIGAVTSGYSALVDANLARQSWDLIANYPGMLLAAAGTAALTLVTVTSIRIARRRLRYESWHLLHLYAYLGVGLAVPHQLWTGADFVASPVARAYWLTLYGLAAGAVLTYRVALPALRTFRHQVSVLSVDREAPDVITVHLAGRDLHRLRAQAGQYFLWRFLDGPGWSRGHPYSLSAAPRGNRVRITARSSTETGARLSALRPGTWVQFEGPYGRLTGQRRSGTTLACFAGGIGITPLRALLEELPYAPGEAVLIYRAHSEADLVFRAELDELAARRGLAVHYLVGPRAADGSWLPADHAGDDTEAIRALIGQPETCDVFVCGPTQWADAVQNAALGAGVARSRLHTERFAW